MDSYIFLGPELGKKQEALEVVKKKNPGAEVTVFYAGETPAGTIAGIIQNHSLFYDTRLFIVKNADLFKKKDEIELIVSCIKSRQEGAALVLLSDELRLASALDDSVPKSNRQVFYELFEREKTQWLRNFFSRCGLKIDQAAIDVILEMVENNTEALSRECTRLVSFLPKGEVQAADVENWLSHNREESAFSLFSRIAAGDFSKAIESVHTLLAAKESGQSILAGLAWCFRKLGDYLALPESARTDNFELRKIGLSSPKARDDYIAAARIFNLKAAERCLALTAEYDILLRSPVSVMEDILMDRYILAVFDKRL